MMLKKERKSRIVAAAGQTATDSNTDEKGLAIERTGENTQILDLIEWHIRDFIGEDCQSNSRFL